MSVDRVGSVAPSAQDREDPRSGQTPRFGLRQPIPAQGNGLRPTGDTDAGRVRTLIDAATAPIPRVLTLLAFVGLAGILAGCGGSDPNRSAGAREFSRSPAPPLTESASPAGEGIGAGRISKGGSNTVREPLRSVVLVTVDTLRIDRLGCYGARTPATPAYDRLAREGAVFDNAVATDPLTLPSHVSMLTGRYPEQHGVRGNGNFALPRNEATLAALLADAGFETAAFVGAFPLSYRFGVGRGFGHFDDDFGTTLSPSGVPIQRSERRAREVNTRALEWFSARRAGRFFLWVHYFDPHFEYAPEEPFASRYPGRPYDGEVAATDAALGGILEALDREGLAGSTAVLVMADHGEGLGDHGEAFHGVFLYDSTIHVPLLVRAPGFAPEGVRIREPVSGADLAPTILGLMGIDLPPGMSGRRLPGLFTADAGARAAETRRDEGGQSALLAAGTDRLEAGDTGTSAPAPVPQDGPEKGGWGPSSAASADAFLEDGILCESYGPWFEFGWSPLLGLRDTTWKFIEAPEPELYDLASDPGEIHNLAPTRPEMVVRARRRLEAKLAHLRAAGRTAAIAAATGPEAAGAAGARTGKDAEEDDGATRGASREDMERLRSLGYAVSPAAPRLPAPGGGLRDPKSMRGFEEAYYRAFALLNAGRIEESIAASRSLVARDPRAPLVHQQLGRALRRGKQFEEAEREFEEALRLSPSLAEAAFDLGAIREALSDPAGAETWYRKALAINPNYPEAHAALARRRYSAGDYAGARAEIGAALALAPSDALYKRLLDSLDAKGAPKQ